ncbi:MAG: gephyrin-like molybdotransferase Glp [Leptospirillia bacterium]
MIPFEDALKQIMDTVPTVRHERVALLSALGRVLTEDVVARRAHPPWDNTAVDGYAVRSVDTAGASPENPVTLNVIETIPAGAMPERTVGAGEASRIMTGAPMPDGADSVVMVEDTRGTPTSDSVGILRPTEATENIRPMGEDVRPGDVVVKAGSALSPADIGMLASVGRSQLTVTRRPTVGILSTGDEIADLDEPLTDNKILNVNSYALAAQVEEAGAVPVILGIAKDDRDTIKAAISEGLQTDVLLISGGVSMGDFDYVKEILDELGGGLDFWKVRIKPARPLAFGMIGGTPAFGLPGNPVSSMVSFELFVRPYLKTAMGHPVPHRPVVSARLTETVRKRAGRRFFLRAVVTPDGDGYSCRTTGSQGSGILTSMVLANGLIDLPESLEGPVETGTRVTVHMF